MSWYGNRTLATFSQRMKGFRLVLLIILFYTLPSPVNGQFYYGLHQDYGKNRVEFNEFVWNYYRFEKIDVYFYKSADDVAKQVAILAEENLEQLEKLFDSPIQDRMSIVVFNNLSELKQSNLLPSDEESYNTGGITHIAGSKMFLYFNGSYADLKGQVRKGMAEMILNNLIYGSFGQSFKNSTLLNFPEWYFEGLISFMSGPLTARDEALLMDGFLTKRFKRFNALTGEEARVAGHSIWQYIATAYGTKVIKDVLFMAIINRNVDDGFRFILGADLKVIMGNWRDNTLYDYRLKDKDKSVYKALPGEILMKTRKDERLTHLAMDPTGTKAALVVNRQGRYALKIIDLEKGRKKTIIKGGYRIPQNADYSFPVPAWHPNGRILAYLTEEKGFLWLNFYDTKKKKSETKEFFKFDKVLSMEYSSDGKQLLMAAVKNGQSDIYLYTILNKRAEPITEDIYDDSDPHFIQGDKRIVFRSNRTTTLLEPVNKRKLSTPTVNPNFDLFIANRTGRNQRELWRLSNSPSLDELNVNVLNSSQITYTAKRDGFHNTYLIEIDSNIAYVDTTVHYNYTFSHYQVTRREENTLNQVISPKTSTALNTYYVKGRTQLRKIVFDTEERNKELKQNQIDVSLPEEVEIKKRLAEVVIVPDPGPRPRGDFDLADYQFHPSLTKGRKIKKKPSIETDPGIRAQEIAFPAIRANTDSLIIPNQRNYFTSFYQDEFTTQIDNIFSNPQYQPFTGTPSPGLLNAGFNMLFKLGVVDLFNNYKLTGGMRTDFQPVAGLSLSPNSEFFIGLSDQSKRMNKALMLYRRSRYGEGNSPSGIPALLRVITHEATFSSTYPINPVSSFVGTLGYRHDRQVVLSTDGFNLPEPAFNKDFGIFRLAYIYDNTRHLGLNLYEGLRYKIFTEYYKDLTRPNTGMHTLGIDLRHYLPLHRTIIWANRLAYGTSFGPQKLIHFMGGVDNEFSPDFDRSTPIAQDENYIFQTVVTNMRGFFQNARNGNSFMVINSEVRVPVFKYLLNRPIRNDFIANFQFIVFGDVGTAWNGDSPWSEENALNTLTINKPPSLSIIIDRQKDPILYGTGFGMRTRLLGYFVRADWAWGIEDGNVLPRVFYFSLSTDF